jgi:hypothetical protein
MRSLGSIRSRVGNSVEVDVHLAGDIIDGSRCSAYTRTDESPFLGVPRTGANGGTTPGAHRGPCHRTAACGHHRQQGQSRQHTHDACLYHWVLLLLSHISDIAAHTRRYSPMAHVVDARGIAE